MEDDQKNKLDHSELLRLVYSEDHVESEKDQYIGELSGGKRNGYGILLYSNGNRYLGQFEDNQFCGEGIFYFSLQYLFHTLYFYYYPPQPALHFYIVQLLSRSSLHVY